MSEMLDYFTILKVIVFWVAIVILQIFLSKRKSKWFGLILPPISFLVSIKVALSIPDYWRASVAQNNLERIKIFLLNNIATVVFIAIFLIFHGKLKKNKEIDKMNIQDLN